MELNWIEMFFLGCFVVGNRQYMNRLQCSLSLLAFCDTLTYKINKSHLLPTLPFTASEWVFAERVTNGNEKLYFPWICFRWIIINYHPAQLCLKGFFLSGEAISLPSRSHLHGIVVLGLPLFTLFPCNFLLPLFVSFSAFHWLSPRSLTKQNCRLSLTWKGYKWINKKELLFGFEMPENSKCTNFSWHISRHTNKLHFVSFRFVFACSLARSPAYHSTSRVHLLNGKQKYANFLLLLLLLLYLWCGVFFGCRWCNSFIHSFIRRSTTKNLKTKKFAFHCLCGIPSMS